MRWNDTVHCLTNCLNGLAVSDVKGSSMRIDAGFALLCAWTESLRDTTGTIFLVGNGASAAMASHVAADLAKNGQVHTEVFSDLALIHGRGQRHQL